MQEVIWPTSNYEFNIANVNQNVSSRHVWEVKNVIKPEVQVHTHTHTYTHIKHFECATADTLSADAVGNTAAIFGHELIHSLGCGVRIIQWRQGCPLSE